MRATSDRVTVDPGWIAFDVLRLFGKDRDALRKLGGRWQPVASLREPGGLLERWSWRAYGKAQGQPITLDLLVRLYQGRVWAVGIHADGYLFQVERTEDGRPYLVAVERTAATPTTSVNWISIRDGTIYDVGLAP